VIQVAMMIIGAVWYGPLFGKQWMRVIGVNPNNKKAVKKMEEGVGGLYFLQFVVGLIQAGFIVFLMSKLTLSPVGVALLVLIGVLLPVGISSVLWDGHTPEIKKKKFFINAGYDVLFVLVSALLFSLFG